MSDNDPTQYHKRKLSIQVWKPEGVRHEDKWVEDWNETTVTTHKGIRERFETLAKAYGSRKSSEDKEAKQLDPVRQILRRIRKKVDKKKDILGLDCFQHNYNRAHIEFLSLSNISLDHEPEFALKRLYRAAAHIVKTIELLEQEEEE